MHSCSWWEQITEWEEEELLVLPVHIMAVLDHLLQLLLSNPFHDNHSADPEDVREAIVDDAVCWLVVSTWKRRDRMTFNDRGHQKLELCLCGREKLFTCASALLIVVLNGLADGVVDNKPHIRLVDAHSKCNCGYDDLQKHSHELDVQLKQLCIFNYKVH